MLIRPKQKTAHKMYWRKIALDFIWIPIAFVSAYAISSHFNFSDNYYAWAQQYESSLDIDELLPALLASLLALLWFANRRVLESKQLLKKNHALVQRVMDVQEDERKRIARDLHDDLGQYLTAINAQASSLLIDTKLSINAKLSAKSIMSSANHAYQVTHHLIRSLRPVALDELGLSVALEHLIDTWQNRGCSKNDTNKPQTNLNLSISGNIDCISEIASISIFRIVQEALTNIFKHAHAQNASIHIQSDSSYLKIEIKDNGVGFDINKQLRGYGLLGIVERVESLGGSLEISSVTDMKHQNTGTRINILIKV